MLRCRHHSLIILLDPALLARRRGIHHQLSNGRN